ncbi:hypothetical protein [Spiroplasma floricola]|uniref:DUF3137 domain-containing protein n=1 Tax=Spiroplasma floricola 23-6 TaxID=1336749 RepID=A0A2K8SCE2_9MOLU|nr:hypothetical protein [Spiroplasma floricola]AUB31137.1 hypothetical protein SFLOR_v1c00760 [Spiroplasma floricola 23-6]
MIDEKLYSDIKEVVNKRPEINKIWKQFKNERKTKIILYTFLSVFFGAFVFLAFMSNIIDMNNEIIFFLIGMFLFLGFLAFLIASIVVYFKLKNINVRLNKIVNEKLDLELIYFNFFNSSANLKNCSDFKMNIISYYPKIVDIDGSYKVYLAHRKVPIKEDHYNSLEFTYKNRKVTFIIEHPKNFIERHYYTSNGRSGCSRTVTPLSMTVLYVTDDKYVKDFKSLRIERKKGNLKGDYKSESIVFNDRYSTNLTMNNIVAAKFLTPYVLDNLANLNQKDFFSLGVNKDIYVEKATTKYHILPFGIFDFYSYLNEKNLATVICKEMISQLNLVKNSLEYVSFLEKIK